MVSYDLHFPLASLREYDVGDTSPVELARFGLLVFQHDHLIAEPNHVGKGPHLSYQIDKADKEQELDDVEDCEVTEGQLNHYDGGWEEDHKKKERN